MSPKKIILISLTLLAMLSAATLAYYLPRLQGDAATDAARMPPSQQGDAKSDIEALITAPPTYPDQTQHEAAASPEPVLTDATGEAPVTLPEPVPPQTVANAAPPKPLAPPTQPRSQLLDALKNPPIQFETKSTRLTASSQRYLDELAVLLRRQGVFHLTIQGHTDSQNRLGKNQMLSETRARAVMQHLVQKGIPARQFEAVGLGGDHPIADNATELGRAKNRRIEFVLRP